MNNPKISTSPLTVTSVVGISGKELQCRNFGSRHGARAATGRYLVWAAEQTDTRKLLGMRRPAIG